MSDNYDDNLLSFVFRLVFGIFFFMFIFGVIKALIQGLIGLGIFVFKYFVPVLILTVIGLIIIYALNH